MQFKFRSPTPPRTDELSEIIRLLGEVKASLTRLSKDTTQHPTTQANSNHRGEVCNEQTF